MDSSSTLLIIIVAIVSNGALLVAMRNQLAPDARAAAQSWLYGTATLAVAVLAFMYPTLWPAPVRAVPPNGLAVAGLFWYAMALRQFDARPVAWWWLVGAVAVVMVLLTLPVIREGFQWRVAVVSLVCVAIMVDSLRSLRGQVHRSPAASALAWLYVVVLVAGVLRAGYFLWFPPGPDFHVAMAGHWMNRLTPVLGVLLPTMGTSAFILMCYHRQYRQVRREAQTDTLTGLGNRSLLARLLAPPRSPDAAPRYYGAVLLIDLDGFKQVNDRHGHAAGDAVLTEVSRRLRGLARPQDIVLRLGGDEFALVISEGLSPARAGELARRVQQTVAGSYETDAGLLPLGASVGLAVSEPGSPQRLDALLQRADLAMYRAKREGGGYRVAGEDAAPAPRDQ